jgi:hypothetical protein
MTQRGQLERRCDRGFAHAIIRCNLSSSGESHQYATYRNRFTTVFPGCAHFIGARRSFWVAIIRPTF